MKYDAILVLGSGINLDGSFPDSVKSTIEKAVELIKTSQADKVIFSGKWSYTIDYTPPITESKAMAEYAAKLGLPKKAICLEEQSCTTVSNAYYIKTKFLIPNNWHRVVLVSNRPRDERAEFVLKTVFGPDYTCDLITTDFSFPPEILKEKEAKEKEKIVFAQRFFKLHNLKPGDHETIKKVTDEDLDNNWRKR